MIDYSLQEADFYDTKTKGFNVLGNWFHGSRNHLVGVFIQKYYKKDFIILDLGCGNVLWNENNLPVIGVDVNEKYLDYNLKKGKISKKILSDISKMDLPDNFADVIVITEVLEHLTNPEKQIKEIFRILKPNGIVISSVPYDTNLSLWKPLFALQCLYQGNIKGNEYYKQKCGHINNFSKRKIAKLFINQGLKILEQYNHSFFTIFTIAQK